MQLIFGLIAVVFGLLVAAILLTVVLIPLCKMIGIIISHVFTFIGGEIKDALRVVGAVITAVVFSFLVVGNVLIFRWSAASHFGRAFSAEIAALGSSLYRIFVGHPARLLGLKSLVDGIENRVPQAVAAAPTRDKPTKRTGQFEHYKIVGSLRGGGSGGKLYIAEPDDIKLASFSRNGHPDAEQVVIKAFSLKDGSSLPQIVRESRSLDAAKKLGLVLDHELTPERFYYVMKYVPGESLGTVTTRLHASEADTGLGDVALGRSLGYVEHLLATLRRYHDGGLWHKDVKPDNIIIHGESAHLVDFGLITPLRSAMTLTTHGTEYFRDPEMVRMALKGVKVHEVDGARFDVYAAGAVLYSVIENSFPAHGGLSQISKRCPDAVRWIVRRAMTEYDKRYTSAEAMLRDLQFVRNAEDPFKVKPAELPSVSGEEDVPAEPIVEVRDEEFEVKPSVTPKPVEASKVNTPGGPPRPAPATVAAAAPGRSRPKLRVTNWWSGGYNLDDDANPDPKMDIGRPPKPVVVGVGVGKAELADALHGLGESLDGMMEGVDEDIENAMREGFDASQQPEAPAARPGATVRRPAAEQRQAARARAAERRANAKARVQRHRRGREGRQHASGVNLGVAASLFIFLAFCVGIGGLLVTNSMEEDRRTRDRELVMKDGEEKVFSELMAHSTEVFPDGDFAIAIDDGGLRLATAPAPEAGQTGFSRRFLVIDDFARPLESGIERVLRGTFSFWEQAGMQVVSTLSPADQVDPELVDELIAQAKTQRGQFSLTSNEAGRAMTAWLDKHDAADIVVWIDPPEAGEGSPVIRWFGSSEMKSVASPSATEALSHQLEVLADQLVNAG